MYPRSFQRLIEQFNTLPGIGPKMAERLVLFLFKQNTEKIDQFISDLTDIHNIKTCKICFNITQDELCTICSNKNRDHHQLCIVEEPLDIIPIERARAFNGVYHVLGGTLKRQNTNNLTITALIDRIKSNKFDEIIIATNFTTEGDMTALHIKKLLTSKKIKLTRIARGLATGSDIEYADDMTIRGSLENRQDL